MLGENFDQLLQFFSVWVILFDDLLTLVRLLQLFGLFRQLSKFLPRLLIDLWLSFFMRQRFFEVNLDVVFLLDTSELFNLGSLAARIVGRLSQTWRDAIFPAMPSIHTFGFRHRAQSISLGRSLSLLCLEIGVSPPLIIILRRNSSSQRLLRASESVLIHGTAPL